MFAVSGLAGWRRCCANLPIFFSQTNILACAASHIDAGPRESSGIWADVGR